MYICRRLFVVPLADNDHGKSTIIRSMVSQAIGKRIDLHRIPVTVHLIAGAYHLLTPY